MADHRCLACGHTSAVLQPTCGRCGAPSSTAPPVAAPAVPAVAPPPVLDDQTVARAHLHHFADPISPPTAPPSTGWAATVPPPATPFAPAAPAMPSFPPAPGPAMPRVDIGARVLAYLVDTVVVLVVLGVPLLVLDAVLPDPDPYGLSSTTSASEVLRNLLTIGWCGVCLFAFVWTTGVSGQTVGKRLLGQQVVDVRTGDVIGFGRSAQRFLVEWLSNVACYAGMWSAFLDSGSGRYQAWHDKACSTWVVSVPRRGIDRSLWSRAR